MMSVNSSTCPVSESLTDDVGAAHHVDLLVARSGLGPLDRLGEAADEGELVPLGLLLRAMGHDEERHPHGLVSPQCPAAS